MSSIGSVKCEVNASGFPSGIHWEQLSQNHVAVELPVETGRADVVITVNGVAKTISFIANPTGDYTYGYGSTGLELTHHFVKLKADNPQVVFDAITNQTHLSRLAEGGPMVNILLETVHDRELSPLNVEFAFADFNSNPAGQISAANIVELIFAPFPEACGYTPPNIINIPCVCHLIEEDLYFDMLITSWGAGTAHAGEVTYDRSNLIPASPAKLIAITESDYGCHTQLNINSNGLSSDAYLFKYTTDPRKVNTIMDDINNGNYRTTIAAGGGNTIVEEQNYGKTYWTLTDMMGNILEVTSNTFVMPVTQIGQLLQTVLLPNEATIPFVDTTQFSNPAVLLGETTDPSLKTTEQMLEYIQPIDENFWLQLDPYTGLKYTNWPVFGHSNWNGSELLTFYWAVVDAQTGQILAQEIVNF